MKRTKESKVSITKPLLTGLNVGKPSNTSEKGDSKKPVPTFGKTSTVQSDLNHDSGGGYNSNGSSIQD